MDQRTIKTTCFWIGAGAILLSCLLLPWYILRDKSIRSLFEAGLERDRDPGNWSQVDKILADAPDGDIAIQFPGFDGDVPQHGLEAGYYMARGSYALAPRRIRFADDGKDVMGGAFALRTHFSPTPQWLMNHRIRWLFTISKERGPTDFVLSKVLGAPAPEFDEPRFKPVPDELIYSTPFLFWCVVYVLVVLVVGYAITAAILPRDDHRSVTEIGGLVLLLGAGGTGMMLLLLSLLRARPERSVVLLVGLAALFAIVVLALRGRHAKPRLPRLAEIAQPINLLLPLPILAMLAVCFVSSVIAVGIPTVNWDSFVMWGLKAKILYSQPLTPRPAYFMDRSLGFTHLDYPLLFPMMLAGAYGMMDGMNDQLGKIILTVLLAGEALIAYSGARMWLGRVGSMVITMLLICIPCGLVHYGLAHADTTLAVFRLGAVIYMARWVQKRQRADLVLAAIFCVFAGNTKNEGMPLAVISAMILIGFVARKNRRDKTVWIEMAIFAGILIVGIGPWQIWRSPLPHIDENYGSRITWPIISENIGRVPVILWGYLRGMASLDHWGGLWILLPILAGLGYSAFRRIEARLLWVMLITHLALYTFVYVITNWDVKTLMRDSLERLFLHIVPLVALILAVHWGAIWPEKEEPPPLPVYTSPPKD